MLHNSWMYLECVLVCSSKALTQNSHQLSLRTTQAFVQMFHNRFQRHWARICLKLLVSSPSRYASEESRADCNGKHVRMQRTFHTEMAQGVSAKSLYGHFTGEDQAGKLYSRVLYICTTGSTAAMSVEREVKRRMLENKHLHTSTVKSPYMKSCPLI